MLILASSRPVLPALLEQFGLLSQRLGYGMSPRQALLAAQEPLAELAHDPRVASMIAPLHDLADQASRDPDLDISVEVLSPLCKKVTEEIAPLMTDQDGEWSSYYNGVREAWIVLDAMTSTSSSSRLHVPRQLIPYPQKRPSSIPPPFNTEQDRVQELTRKRSWIETMPDPIGVFEVKSDGSVKILMVNQAAQADSGFTEDEIINIDFRDLVHPDDRDRFYHTIGMTLGSGSGVIEKLRVRKKDGSYMTTDLRIGFHQANKMGWYLMIDETKRYEAMSHLERIQTLLRDSDLALFMLDLPRNRTPRVSLVSRRLEQQLGYAQEQMEGMLLQDLLVDGQENVYVQKMLRFFRENAMRWMDVKLKGRDGRVVEMDIEAVRSRTQDSDGAIVWLTPSCMRQQREQHALQAQRFNQEREIFHNISHDILNLLTGVMLDAELMRRHGKFQGLTAEQDALVSSQENCLKKIAVYMRSTIEPNLDVTSTDPMDLNALLSREFFSVMIGQSAHLTYVNKLKHPANVLGSQGRLQEIISDVIKNALEATVRQTNNCWPRLRYR